MYRTSKLLFLNLFSILILSCSGQDREGSTLGSKTDKMPIGGNLENRHFTYMGIPKAISAADTSPGWWSKGQKILLTGTVYLPDGKTPAPDVMLYYYQTNTEGRYLHKPQEPRSMPPNELGQTHGYIRGWVKTGKDGKYFIYTVMPGSYPSFDEPAHVHITVKEPDINEYYIDDFVFDDDRLLTSSKRKKMENRGGSGILRIVQGGDLLVGERNLYLGLNIPGYPVSAQNLISSGNQVGEDVFSFTPFHAWGPDKGTKTCPVCKYGWYHGVLYFVGNNPDWEDIKKWLLFLEAESVKRKGKLKVYFVYGNELEHDKGQKTSRLEKIGKELELKNVALTFVPSFSDVNSEIELNRISQTVDNTFILYKRSRIIAKFINLKAVDPSFDLVSSQLDESINEYFHLPHPTGR